jgi:hypothetical protein
MLLLISIFCVCNYFRLGEEFAGLYEAWIVNKATRPENPDIKTVNTVNAGNPWFSK